MSGLADVFGIEGHGFLFPVYMRIVLHQPRHPQDHLGTSQVYNHQRQVVLEVGGLAVYGSGSSDSSLFVDSSINIKGL